MSAATVATVGALVHSFPELLPLLDEHLKDNEGEVLPHLVMSDIFRWLIANRVTASESCRAILSWLEDEVDRETEGDVAGMIAVSGVIMIPDPGEPGSEIRDWLGPSLRRLDPWQPA